MKEQSKISVKRAVWNTLMKKNINKPFLIIDLLNDVRNKIDRQHIFDGSILRKLRELREENIIDYSVLDKTKSIYLLWKCKNLDNK